MKTVTEVGKDDCDYSDGDDECISPKRQPNHGYAMMPGISFAENVSGVRRTCECGRILLADDNAFNLMILQQLLKNLNVSTVTVLSPTEPSV